MAKKQFFAEDEVPIFENRNGAVVFRRGENWQFRVWLTAENKYVQKSLHTKIRETAIERGQALYLELHAHIERGVKYYSISLKEAVETYTSYRATEVRDNPSEQGIVAGRLETIKTHLNHFLDSAGRDTKLSELEENQLLAYPQWRRSQRKTADTTIRNEMSTINACMAYLYDVEKMGSFRQFYLPKYSKARVDTARVKRETFEADEYMAFVRAMREYVREDVDPDELHARQLVRHYFLVAANSGMRSGELAQLSWDNVNLREIDGKTIATVNVLAATSKVGKQRTFMHREGEYYQRWREIAEHKTGIIFSVDGTTRYPRSSLYKHFKRIMALAEIDPARKPHLVPYSFRHFAITQRVMSGLHLQEVAQMTGTSLPQVEETYYHLNEAQMQRAALADYVRDKNGKIIPTM